VQPTGELGKAKPKLRYVRQVASPQFLLVDVVVDIDRLAPDIAPQLLDELAWHAGAPEMGRKPMSAAMRAKALLQGHADILEDN